MAAANSVLFILGGYRTTSRTPAPATGAGGVAGRRHAGCPGSAARARARQRSGGGDVADIVSPHESAQLPLHELQRNPALLALCGFPAFPRQGAPKRVVSEADGSTVIVPPQLLHDPAPDARNFSRFLRAVVELEEEQGMISGMIPTTREQLMEEGDDFGVFLGCDGKAMESHSTGAGNRATGETLDPDADLASTRRTGSTPRPASPGRRSSPGSATASQAIADTQYEISVAASVTRVLVSEIKELEGLSEQLFEEMSALAERCREFTADRGLCRGPLKAMLWDQHRIRPLVDSRAMWSANMQQPDYDPAKSISRPLFRNRDDCITHTERGEVICKCPATRTERPMAFEAGRSTLKYRCPASAAGFKCLGSDACHKDAGCKVGAFGPVVRIDLENHGHHIFSPTRQDSTSRRCGSNRRNALERIYSRLDNGFGFEHHTIRGKAR